MKALFWSAVINGVVAVPLMAVIILLASKKSVMGALHREPLAHHSRLDRDGGHGRGGRADVDPGLGRRQIAAEARFPPVRPWRSFDGMSGSKKPRRDLGSTVTMVRCGQLTRVRWEIRLLHNRSCHSRTIAVAER